MVTAESIFNSVGIEESHIIIGSDRVITVPSSLQRIGVEHDHDIETVTFECPRYWDEHDLSTMAIYINYVLSSGYADSYPVDNVTVQEDIILFTWTISRNVTQVKGNIKFLACAKKVDGEGNETLHWNSELCEDMYVSKGLETAPQITEDYPDLITELLLRVKSIQDINIQAGEMQDILDETKAVAVIAEEAKNVATDEANYIKNSYANALKGNASGKIVRVGDVSPVEHIVDVSVRSKNLVSIGEYPITLSGNAITGRVFSCDISTPFTVSCDITINDIGNQGGAFIAFTYDDGTASYLVPKTSSGTNVLTISNGKRLIKVELINWTGVVGSLNWFQLEEGTTATEYEPYVDPSAITVTKYGKNLFPSFDSETNNGVTLSRVGNYYVLNGTATASGFFVRTRSLPAGTYTISASNPTHNNNALALVQIYSHTVGYQLTAWDNAVNAAATATIQAANDWQFRIRYENGVTYKNFIVKPQLELGSVATEYEEYVPYETYTPNADGSVDGVKSVSPNMTLLTNNANMAIEVEYNKDLNATFNEIMSMITSIIGVVVFDEELAFAYDEGSAMYLALCDDISAITYGSYVLKVGDGVERNITIAYSDEMGLPAWTDESGEIIGTHVDDGSDSYIGFVREALSRDGTYRITLRKKS